MANRERPSSGDVTGNRIPRAVKVAYSLFVAVLVPVYTWHYGLANFLWFSNIALFTGLAAVWLESRWLASMQAVSVSLLEMFWIFDFVGGLFLGRSPAGMTAYMLDPENPLFVRALSLYHLVLPFLLLWVVYRLGYERRAWIAQTFLAWAILLICYLFTDPRDNINWVFGGLGEEPQTRIPSALYLVLLMTGFAGGVYLPAHWLLTRLYSWLRRRALR